jgi:hypothetical protein
MVPALLHCLYMGSRKFCLVFPRVSLVWGVAENAPRHAFIGVAVDILFLAVFAVFLLLALALVAGCASLERKK